MTFPTALLLQTLLVCLLSHNATATEESTSQEPGAFRYRQFPPILENDIICEGQLPLQEKGNGYWPARRYRENFFDRNKPEAGMQTLCAASTIVERPTMGCICLLGPSGAREVVCSDHYADRYLINAGKLRRLCLTSCRCPAPELPTSDKQVEVDEAEDVDWVNINRVSSDELDGTFVDSSGDSKDTVFYDAEPLDISGVFVIDEASKKKQRLRQQQQQQRGSSCGGQCSGFSGCADQPGCHCVASRFNGVAEPVAASNFFVSFCAGVLSGRKRGVEEMVCPCNSTYISGSCCRAESGIVWEDPVLNQGRLMTVDDDDDEDA